MISIIIPVYNVKAYLHKCVNSVIAQTYSDLEIVLIDDGSTDGSGELCDELATLDARIRVIHKENGGPASACKLGAETARGEIIGFVDSDDCCEREHFEVLVGALLANDADIAICGYTDDFEQNPEDNRRHRASAYLADGVYEGEKLQNIKETYFSRKNVLYWAKWLRVFKKPILTDNLKYFAEDVFVGDEVGIALATFLDAKKIVIVDVYGYNYLQRSGSIMHSVTDKEIANYESLCKNIERVCRDKGYGQNICREFTSQLFIAITRLLHSNSGRREKIRLLKQLRKTETVKRVFKEHDFGERSKKGRIVLWLFKNSFFGAMTLLPLGRSQK